jgi:ribosomal protein L3 glutamine methyltransferase
LTSVSSPLRPGATVEDAVAWAAARFDAAELAFGHGTASAGDEAAYLVSEAFRIPFSALALEANRELGREEMARLASLVEARIHQRRPTAYLVGRAYIGGFGFRADDRALVPRSYIGELLVSAIDGEAPLPFLGGVPTSILDLGTGSASLAILAAIAFPDAVVDAVDISADALALAAENVADYGLADRIRLLAGNLYAPVAGRRYDLILSNPPYVEVAAMARLPAEYRHEPAVALAGGGDGMAIVAPIVAGAAAHLEPGGGLLCEIGMGQAGLAARFPDTPFLWLDTETSTGELFWLDARSAPPDQNP